MDNQILPTPNSRFKFLNRRNIFIALGVVIVLEIIWAGWTLLGWGQSIKPQPPVRRPPDATTQAKPTKVSLEADRDNLKVDEKVTISIKLSSSKKTDGTDLIILYDPKLLSVEAAASPPVTVGTIYSDYPKNEVDNKEGRITVSGITGVSGGVLPDGLFGSFIFKALVPGTAKVSLDFKKGNTGDSNVVESGTGQDVLESVTNLELNILP